MNDAEFLAALESGTLPPEQFSHRGHLRAAWLYLERHSLPEAAKHCALAIRNFAAGAGVPEKFHLTLTLAFMHVLADLRATRPATDWETFLAACPELESDARALIARHYSEDALASERARVTFVPPDREPLPG